MDLIKLTAENVALDGCDLIVECVFENMDLKHKVIGETECCLAKDGVFASNTSTLPITELAKAAGSPRNFIGLHFFFPVDKMPLVEIISGENTSAETLVKGFDYVQQIRKVPIVVNDARGFFTSRAFGMYIDEGCRMVKEGLDPVLVDAMGRHAGMPVGPLTVHDEITQELAVKVSESNKALDEKLNDNFCAINPVMDEMSWFLVKEHDRCGCVYGGGWYDYPEKGDKQIWPKFYKLFYKSYVELPREDLIDRILFCQIVEALRCYQERVFNEVRDGNIGSIMGIGFPPFTGGQDGNGDEYRGFVNAHIKNGREKMACITKRRDWRMIDLYDQFGKRRWKTLPKNTSVSQAKIELRHIENSVERGCTCHEMRSHYFRKWRRIGLNTKS